MKKIMAITLTITSALLGTSALSAYGSTPIKINSTCSKPGAKATVGSTSLVCKLLRKKLVWQAVPKASQLKALIPITLPVKPYSTLTFENLQENASSIPEVAWQNTQSAISTNASLSLPLKLSIGENTGVTSSRVTTLLEKEFRLWNGFFQPSTFTGLIFNAADEKWAESQWPALAAGAKVPKQFVSHGIDLIHHNCNFNSSAIATECYAGNAFDFPGAVNGIALFGVQEPYWLDSSNEYGPVSQITHEYNHLVQFAQWRNSPQNKAGIAKAQASHNFMPCWFQEGQANAIGISIAAPNVVGYVSARDNSVRRLPNANSPAKPSFTEMSAANISKYLTGQNAPSCYAPATNGDYQYGYSIGFAATEALIAIGGPKATMTLLAQGANGLSWNQAFQSVYGISWDSASKALASALAAEYAAKPMNHQ